MEVMSFLNAVLALFFVLGLLLVTLWFIKYMQVKTPKSKLFKKLNEKQRIEILETKRIDAKNMLAIVRKDNKEFFMVLGVNGNLLLDEGEFIEKVKIDD